MAAVSPQQEVFALSLGLSVCLQPRGDAGPAVERDTTGVIEEIVVTARERQESLVDVPSSFSVVSGDCRDLANQLLAPSCRHVDFKFS